MSKKINAATLSYQDKLALRNHYNPSMEQMCSAFGNTQDELNTVFDLEKQGVFVASADLDVEAYADVFTSTALTDTESTTSIKKPGEKRPAETATKRAAVPRKRGRKGDNIRQAFKDIPTSPTPVEDFAKKYGVSVNVLRQGKRFDEESTGRVRVKKEKSSGVLMIWREV